MIQLHHLKGIRGGESPEDSNTHLKGFIEVCALFNVVHISQESIWLHLYPFSLKGNMVLWLKLLPAGSINSGKSYGGILKSILPTFSNIEIAGWDC